MRSDAMLAARRMPRQKSTDPAAPGSVAGRQGSTDRSARATDRQRHGAQRATPHRTSDTAFAQAARLYDPRCITRAQMASMAALLLGHGVISDRDHLILQTDPTAGRMAVARDLAAPRDAIKDWQTRRETDMGRGRIRAVEASTRALAILGRIAALRDTETGPEAEGRSC